MALLLAATAACSGTAKPTAPAAPPAPAPAAGKAPVEGDKPDPAFPRVERGWKTVDRATREAMHELAGRYREFLAAGKTERRATAALIARFGDCAGELTGEPVNAAPGARYVLHGPGGRAAALVVAGQRPIEEGLRIVIASVDAPRFELKQQPLYDAHGFAMLDTAPTGSPNLASWLVTPLALYLYAARPGAADGPLDLAIGEADGDPVFVIPDLLPHLSGKVQRKAVVDSAERMDAIGARSRAAILDYLRARGFSADDFAISEAVLVPAGEPVFYGVDRAMVGGYGQHQRALAFAAVDALIAEPPHYTSMVVLTGGRLSDDQNPAGEPFVRRAILAAITGLSSAGADADMLATRRIFARSAALVGRDLDADLGGGVALAPTADDALPQATRRAVDAITAAGAQYQYGEASGWGDPARRLSGLDLDAVDLAVPVADRALPMQRISVFDLFHAGRACRGWFGGR
jgi:hypothetical protein